MKTETTAKTNVTYRLAITCGIVAILLLIPLVAMQITGEVNWDLFDFVVMGVLLLLTGLGIEMVTRKVKSTNLKIGLCLGILLLLLLIWAELAVGIFGTPIAGS
jgi:DMSO/TMAO reductase YedYZ heme-binding membrane subunit